MRKKEEKRKETQTAKKESTLVTKESLCAVGALFSALAFFILCTNEAIFGSAIGGTIFDFLIGVFGLFAYPVFLGAFYVCGMGLIGKRLVKSRKAMTFFVLSIISLGLILHTAFTYSWELDGYITKCFRAPTLSSEESATVVVGGWLGGLIVYPVCMATTKVGAIIIFAVCTLFFGYLTYISWKHDSKNTQKKEKKTTESGYGAPVEIPLMQPSQGAATGQPTADVSLGQAMGNAYAQPQQVQPNLTQAYSAGNMDVVTQQPAFTLSDEGTGEAMPKANTDHSFSPFGKAENMRAPQEDTMENSYKNSRDFLFGKTPAEHYWDNLIFDPNSNVNKRNAQPAQPAQSFGNSYADAYQNEVNTQPTMPTKVFTDRLEPYTTQERAQTEQPTPITPIEPVRSTPIAPSESVSSLYTLEEKKEEIAGDYVSRDREEDFLSVRSQEREPSEGNSRYDGGLDRDLFSPSNPNIFGNSESDRAFARETFGDRESALDRTSEERAPFEEPSGRERDGLHLFDEEEDDAYTIRSDFEETRSVETTRDIVDEPRYTEQSSRLENADRFTEVDRTPFVEEEEKREISDLPTGTSMSIPVSEPIKSAPMVQPTPPPPPKPRVIRPYVKPRLDDFDCRDVEPVLNPEEVEETKQNILATLEDFKVTGATIASTTFGPTVTRYNVTIPRNVSPQKVVALDQPIAISLRSSGVNIYPNYEDGVVSIEVPNKERQFVQLGCMLSGDTFVNAKSSSIMFTMGKDAGNRKVYGDISKMIHMLVAGSSGSGKSVFLGSLIISLIYKYSPEELRLILIDPKKTEFVLYNNLPHLMINEIITEAPKAVQSLNWAIGEMNRRYGLFEKMSRAGTYVVNLDQYNAHVEKLERLPKIVIIIDELADLMLAAKKDIEDKIQNLTQKARAAGIHLVVATQRPSTDVITGVIKSNLPTRIAFAVATDVDSRVILDQTGAQKLLGKGDFLYTMQGINTPVRVQSAFISAEDSQRIVNFIKSNNEAYYDETATAYINNARNGGGGDSFGDSDEVEPVYIDALRYVIISNSASISLIQRKCSIGYNKAGKIVEWMEEMGYISSFEGAKARKVLITKEEFESKYGSL